MKTATVKAHHLEMSLTANILKAHQVMFLGQFISFIVTSMIKWLITGRMKALLAASSLDSAVTPCIWTVLVMVRNTHANMHFFPLTVCGHACG